MRKTLKQILETPRMFYVPLKHNNSVEGLFDMICDITEKHFTIVEIGSFSGVSSEVFANCCKKLYCVDVWDMDKSYQEVENSKLAIAEKNFDEMAKDYPNIVKIKNYSEEVAKTFEDESIDMVYIDGRHDYKYVIADIRAWMPKVKKGGWITGHDIDLREGGVDGKRVYEAVTEIFGTNYKTYNDTSWATQKL